MYISQKNAMNNTKTTIIKQKSHTKSSPEFTNDQEYDSLYKANKEELKLPYNETPNIV